MKITNSIFFIASTPSVVCADDSCERYYETLLVSCLNQCTSDDPNCLSSCNRLHDQNLAKCPGQAQCHVGFEKKTHLLHVFFVFEIPVTSLNGCPCPLYDCQWEAYKTKSLLVLNTWGYDEASKMLPSGELDASFQFDFNG